MSSFALERPPRGAARWFPVATSNTGARNRANASPPAPEALQGKARERRMRIFNVLLQYHDSLGPRYARTSAPGVPRQTDPPRPSPWPWTVLSPEIANPRLPPSPRVCLPVSQALETPSLVTHRVADADVAPPLARHRETACLECGDQARLVIDLLLANCLAHQGGEQLARVAVEFVANAARDRLFEGSRPRKVTPVDTFRAALTPPVLGDSTTANIRKENPRC